MATPRLSTLETRLNRLIWQSELDRVPDWQRWLILSLRLVHALGRDLTSGHLSLHAMSLVYTTLLSIIPLLAVSFSVLKGFGVHNQIEPILTQVLAPLGRQSKEVAEQMVTYVDNTNVAVLGTLGLAFLLYSVLSLVSKIELVFNYTWHVDRARPFAERISHYLSVLLIGPVLFVGAFGATASMRSTEFVQWLVAIEPFGLLLDVGARVVPYALIVLAFTFAYTFVPHTRVKLRAALIGALVAGLLWQSVGYLFANFMSGSTRYAAIYSSLAILILFMIWVYIAWLILLIGASIAFYIQFPEFLATRARDLRLSNRLRERVALCIAAEIAKRHAHGDASCTVECLAKRLRLPSTNIRNLLKMLSDAGFVVATADDPPCYVPARSPANIAISEVLARIRRHDEEPPSTTGCDERILALEDQLEAATEDRLQGMSLAELADAGPVRAGSRSMR